MSGPRLARRVRTHRSADHIDPTPPAPPPEHIPEALSSARWWSYRRLWKSVADRLGSVLLLAVLSPVIAGVAVCVRVAIGRPVLFRQQRVGRDGVPFQIYKFRTMGPDRRSTPDRRSQGRAETPERRRDHKSPVDPRHTRVGRLLRRTSLDELPQLVNVVQGSMSLVGPRPELPEIVARYEPWQHLRHLVRPGITGLWQVHERDPYRRMHEFTEIDIDYIGRISPMTDLDILIRTVSVPLKGSSGR